jgi:hypothetical protein
MRSPLRKFFLAPALVAAAAVATSTAMAATAVSVPFNFTVAGKSCPAGKYEIQKGPVANSVRLASADSARSFVWVISPGDPSPTDQRVILTFDRNGDAAALRTVQFGHLITSRLDKPAKEYTPTRIVAGE